MINCNLKDEKIIELDMQGDISADDYKKIEPQLVQLFSERGKMKFLIQLDRLKSFGPGAVYEDIKFDLQNLKNIGPTAIVGDKKSQALLTKFIDKIFPERVKFFEATGEAIQWLRTA